MSSELLPVMAEARAKFMALVAEIRPELHRYCARMTGNVFDGENVVQDTLSKAYFALGGMNEPPSLRPWLFRIAHNAALDFARRRSPIETRDELPEVEVVNDEPPDIEVPLAAFVKLPATQRSAVTLKDVLGHSLEETAVTMGSSVPAVKGALTRGRANLNRGVPEVTSNEELSRLRHYATLFNARDWDALRALLSEEAKLELVSRSRREGRAVREYFGRYSEVAPTEALRAVAGLVDGAPVIAMWRGEVLAYFVLLSWRDDSIVDVRDYYFVPYIANEARFTG